jgi:hypothetical protein
VSCTVTISGGGVSDTDTADPPDAMTTSPSFSFTTQSFAEDDAYNVTPHLTLAVDTGVQSGRVTANDQLGVGSDHRLRLRCLHRYRPRRSTRCRRPPTAV